MVKLLSALNGAGHIASRQLFVALTLLALGFSSTGFAKFVSPDDDAIRYIGRFTDDYRFAWTGTEIETLFKGTTILAELQVVARGTAGLTILVDGEPHFLKIGKGRQKYTLAKGLDPEQVHRISIIKRSEVGLGTVRFYGFELPDGGELIRPPAPERKMLVIGDSITCGYGNEAKVPGEGNTIENQNGYMSYALVAARALNADAMLVCWSGRGMYRNRSAENDQAGTLPKLFDQILPFDADILWDHARFVPDVIVINLGTNDAAELDGVKSPLPKEEFIKTYIAFLERLRELAPEAYLVLSIGPMKYGPVADWLPEIASSFEDTSVLVYAPFSGKADIGGHYHPSVAKAKDMARELVDTIHSMVAWEE
ncbi:SGNH/GDSL hydrolase family protein [Rubellicoccus peritrichatus]|uniref:SGNH/GDSL hydrolase family protein n=1 Tax=Rubellicoccus peritrichatus TaxID=3080537 RepID=A0AAQ3L9B1_9BACT|nr:SGNH/GDSL hydrolase family protein [Puniceicoccus sp. CR14]WOO41022.1 SGNH/GDSL hydrolase family protein [Puniceicoccus sp. CR14]